MPAELKTLEHDGWNVEIHKS
eukprot:SAG11_NODE_17177_length_526_cov_0.594848_1_plen_20_part_10